MTFDDICARADDLLAAIETARYSSYHLTRNIEIRYAVRQALIRFERDVKTETINERAQQSGVVA